MPILQIADNSLLGYILIEQSILIINIFAA